MWATLGVALLKGGSALAGALGSGVLSGVTTLAPMAMSTIVSRMLARQSGPGAPPPMMMSPMPVRRRKKTKKNKKKK